MTTNKVFYILGAKDESAAQQNSPIPCPLCRKQFVLMESFKVHMNDEHQMDVRNIRKVRGVARKGQCPVCQKNFPTKDLIKDHIKTAHRTLDELSKKIAIEMIDKLEIEEDTEESKKNKKLEEEESKKKLETFPCRVCNKRFITIQFLNEHVASLHNTRNSEASTRDALALIILNLVGGGDNHKKIPIFKHLFRSTQEYVLITY